MPVGVSLFFSSFESQRTSVQEVLGPLFICLVEVSELLLICFLEDVPFCTCALGVEILCTNFLEGVVVLCDCLLGVV